MPYALPEDSFLHSKNSPQNRRRHRHGRSPSRTGYSCGSSSFPWCAPFPLPGSDLVVCDFSTFNGKSKWSFCTKFSPYSPVSLSYPPPPREYRPAPCGESTQAQRSPSDVYSRIVYTLFEVQTDKNPQGSDKMVENTVGFCALRRKIVVFTNLADIFERSGIINLYRKRNTCGCFPFPQRGNDCI